MNVIGIDPGLDGGIAYVGRQWSTRALPMPTIAIGTKRMIDTRAFRDAIIDFGPLDMVVIEDVNAGAVKSVMYIETVVDMLERPYMYISPAIWTKGVGITRGAKKPEHIEVARRLYPHLGPLRDGPANALLIAHWYLTTHRAAIA